MNQATYDIAHQIKEDIRSLEDTANRIREAVLMNALSDRALNEKISSAMKSVALLIVQEEIAKLQKQFENL